MFSELTATTTTTSSTTLTTSPSLGSIQTRDTPGGGDKVSRKTYVFALLTDFNAYVTKRFCTGSKLSFKRNFL